MRRIAVGLVTLLVLVSCTDDPTVSGPETSTEVPAATPTQVLAAIGQPETGEPETGEPASEPVVADEPAAPDTADNDGLFPEVVGATASSGNGESWNFAVTLLSEYDSPERYADAWRVLDADDNELGIRVLGHDHAGEQPFTRSHTIDVPTDLATVFIEGRDQLNGWSGERFELTLNR